MVKNGTLNTSPIERHRDNLRQAPSSAPVVGLSHAIHAASLILNKGQDEPDQLFGTENDQQGFDPSTSLTAHGLSSNQQKELPALSSEKAEHFESNEVLSNFGLKQKTSTFDPSASAPVVRLSHALQTASLMMNSNIARKDDIIESSRRNNERIKFDQSTVVQSEAMEDRAGPVLRIGELRNPGELGIDQTIQSVKPVNKKREESNPRENDSDPGVSSGHPETLRQWTRVRQSIRRGRYLQESAANHLEKQQSTMIQNRNDAPIYSSISSFCYNGMEVLLGSSSAPAVYLMSARTRFVLQTLDLPLKSGYNIHNQLSSENEENSQIISIQSNPVSGQVCVAMSNGMIQTYLPIPTNPHESCYSRYRWRNGPFIDCAKIFCREDQATKFVSSACADPGERLDVSMSRDRKVLVAHLDQLALFDGGDENIVKYQTERIEDQEAELLWTTQLPGKVVTAKLSGDGHSIALVMDSVNANNSGDSDDDAEADGVHTFERDWNDGCYSGEEEKVDFKGSISSVRSLGILYKPGPFLVHSAPVTRISFRGLGHCTSSLRSSNFFPDANEKGNDLLLTYCASDCSARMYDQNAWNILTEWTTLPHSRVDWVKGISAFTMGDLESRKKSKREQKSIQSSILSSTDLPNGEGPRYQPPSSLRANNTADKGKEGKMLRFHQSIHHHPVPSSNAGAWVSEITFSGSFPAIRLSRLTYLKRGVDDWHPTLFESISSYLPPGCVFRDQILQTDDAGFSIEGIWPAWNPWLSESTSLSSSEEKDVRGSAMAFLGLSSGPSSSGGGQFGDSLLGGTQHPPCELRIAASYPIASSLVILEFPIFSDSAYTSLELGSPTRSVLSLKHLDDLAAGARVAPPLQANARRIERSIEYDGSVLVAEVDGEGQSLSLTWRRPGTSMILPSEIQSLELANEDEIAFGLENATSWRDDSVLPVPLSLCPLFLPPTSHNKETVTSVLWWSEPCYGSPLMLVLTSTSGTIFVFEIPPPSCISETTMKTDEKPPNTTLLLDMNGHSPGMSFDESDASGRSIYEALITPDPEYGLGLRLESHMDGRCAIVGSFKKHPLNGEIMPAEKSGIIHLGDELLTANDVVLEQKHFDDIVNAVREIGANCGPGNPVRMKFRTSAIQRRRDDNIGSSVVERRQGSQASDSSEKRRTMEQIIGVTPENLQRKSPRPKNDDERPKVPTSTPRQIRGSDGINTILAKFPGAISCWKATHDTKPLMCLIPLTSVEPNEMHQCWQRALLFWFDGKAIVVSMLIVSHDGDYEKGKFAEIGRLEVADLPGSDEKTHICCLDTFESGSKMYQMVVCTNKGQVLLVNVLFENTDNMLDWAAIFQPYPLFKLEQEWCRGSLIRAYSTELIATMQPTTSSLCNEKLLIWESRPGPSSFSSTIQHGTINKEVLSFSPTEIRADSVGADSFRDFKFENFGYLDPFPSLICMSDSRAFLMNRTGISNKWTTSLELSYLTLRGSMLTSSISQSCNVLSRNPRHVFPHIIASIGKLYSSPDEFVFLRSDWHPDAIIAHICSDQRGAKDAIKDGLSYLYLWLCSEGKDIPEDHLECPLAVSPLPIFDDSKNTPQSVLPQKADMLLSLSSVTKDLTSEESTTIRELLSLVVQHLVPKEKATKIAASSLVSTQDSEIKSELDLPPVLRSLDFIDLQLVWSLGELLLDPPSFESVDIPGQLFLFADALFRKIVESPQCIKETPKNIAMEHLFQAKRISSSFVVQERKDSISSVGALSALLSNDQGQLRHSIRTPGQKLTWPRTTQVRLAFWERSDAELAKVAEEIGQNIFRESRDIMDCAIFFLIARKRSTLQNLAATDQSETGKTFFKFLTSHDFSSERGRRAAEKNAFSLLRKNRHRVAAAFFLLPDPPQLKSCVETIVTKMQDFDLAFLVARLMESTQLMSLNGSNSRAGNMGGVLGFGGMLESGGFYPSFNSNSQISTEKPLFSDWRPNLGNETKRLLVERVIPSLSDDDALSGIVLLWLGKREEATWSLSGLLDKAYGSKDVYKLVDDSSPNYFKRVIDFQAAKGQKSSYRTPHDKANSLIDLVSVPRLLRILHVSSRVEQASCLVTSQVLKSRGAELAAIRCLADFPEIWENDENDSSARFNTTSTNGENKELSFSAKQEPTSAAGAVQSSIFDDFDVPPSSKKPTGPTPAPASAAGMKSSILDEFDVSLPPKKATDPIQIPTSTLFDDFYVPLPSKQPAISTQELPHATATMQSSIFDNFDIRPSTQKAAITTQTPIYGEGGMQSSIFNDFDLALPPKKEGNVTQVTNSATGEMQSSIFDNFDVPPPSKVHTTSTLQATSGANGGIKSSVFGGANISDRATKSEEKCRENGDIHPNPSSSGGESSAVENTEYAVVLPYTVSSNKAPCLWTVWKETKLLDAAARRLCREIASVLAQFHGDPVDPTMADFFKFNDILISPRVSEVLQLHCNSQQILGRVLQSFEELCEGASIKPDMLVQRTVQILGFTRSHRPLFLVVLFAAVGRAWRAEEVVRSTANSLIQRCHCMALTSDSLQNKGKTLGGQASLSLRREAARLCWQLESCLWLHRGGGLPLSGVAQNEAIVAVRIGVLVATWNRNFKGLDAMIRFDPDCTIDEDAGRQLWTSLKVVESVKKESKKISSGGWEFLVDCNRSQAAELLKDRVTGTFIIRPHSDDNGVFTISFKTNLVPGISLEGEVRSEKTSPSEMVPSEGISGDSSKTSRDRKKRIRKDDVVQHAVIRLSDSGFRCGSFGPFTSLMSLLEAVSKSLPFVLRFDLPPKNRVIKEEGYQTSPNAVLLRRLALGSISGRKGDRSTYEQEKSVEAWTTKFGFSRDAVSFEERKACIAGFLELMVLSLIGRQLSSVAMAEHGESECYNYDELEDFSESHDYESPFVKASRILSPYFAWWRSIEIMSASDLAPGLERISGEMTKMQADSVTQLEDAIEVEPIHFYGGSADSILRRMIQQNSGVDFSTLRLTDGGECTMVVLFSKAKAIEWLITFGKEKSEADALAWLARMEERRVIEAVNLSDLPIKHRHKEIEGQGVRYRFVDPWEVEAVQNREGETRSACLGRDCFLSFSVSQVSTSTENVVNSLGGPPLLELWTNIKGSVFMTKALASVYPPWERAAGGDLYVKNKTVAEPPAYINSIRQGLYRNTIFRRLDLPQRFVALVQVELLDLKNLTTPGGSVSLTAYALLRLKRTGTGAVLTNKARTLDSASTIPMKLNRTSGPNAPASWGSVVRFRFPLPEDVSVDGESYDRDRDVLFNGPPCVLQVSVYEKKLLVDHSLGRADISTDGLWAGGQLEEWVPLRTDKRGIKWFARIRLTLRFELMCLAPTSDTAGSNGRSTPSVGLKKIEELCQSGGSAQEDVQKRSMSSPDLLSYFEGIVYYGEP